MHDGPIDLIVEAFGEVNQVERAYRAAAARFVEVLDELCLELALLRQPARAKSDVPSGAVARRMLAAVQPYASLTFITPMAAVAGAVAEEILHAMTSGAELARAYVNDGGDIALHLACGEHFVIGMAESPEQSMNAALHTGAIAHPQFGGLFGTTTIQFNNPIRGVATSGWRGRSFSLGIADAVTILADTAAMADAAATVVANAVDLPGLTLSGLDLSGHDLSGHNLSGHNKVLRIPACDLAPDNDLGKRLVTQAVGELTSEEIDCALASGTRLATSLRDSGLIRAAALTLQGEVRVVEADVEAEDDTVLTRQPTAERSVIHAGR